jgi:hypothetical protein
MGQSQYGVSVPLCHRQGVSSLPFVRAITRAATQVLRQREHAAAALMCTVVISICWCRVAQVHPAAAV